MNRTFYNPSSTPNKTEGFQVGTSKTGEYVCNRVSPLEDKDFQQHQADYFIARLKDIEEGKAKYHTFATFDEICEDFNQLLKKRIPVQLEARKQAKKDRPDLYPLFVIPALYKFTDGMPPTAEQQAYFISLCDDERPLTKHLSKKGYLFMTSIHLAVGEPIFMLSATLGKI